MTLAWTLALLAQPAAACGGFFCGGQTTTTTTTQTGQYDVPVQQNSERILFRVNGDGTVTTYVEVGYEQLEDVEFAWVIPIPEVIPASSVSTSSAELFNTLEEATAPQFTFEWTTVNYNYNYGSYSYGYDGGRSSSGCGCGGSADKAAGDSGVTFADGGGSTTVTQEATIVVVEEAVVGPFDIQVITAQDAAEFGVWLGDNGYDLPANAEGPLQHYIDGGMAFLGVKLSPDNAPVGPIDTLEFTYTADAPMIPLILTAIASADRLPMTVYLHADEPWVPDNWAVGTDVAPTTLPDGSGGTTYLDDVQQVLDSHDGRAMVIEYAGATDALPALGSGFDDLMGQKGYLTRWRGNIAPWQMTLDPVFAPDPALQDYSNEHYVVLDFPQGATPSARAAAPDREAPRGRWLVLLPLGLLGAMARRRSAPN